jgi:hypothetical protein
MILNRTVMEVQLSPTCSMAAESLAARAKAVSRAGTVFLFSAAAILAIVGVAKAFSATGPARALDALDPLIGLPFRHLLLSVGLIELLVSFVCVSASRRAQALGAVAWLATNFVLYRIGLWCIDWHHPCGCMGSLAGVLHLSDTAADNIMKGLLVYLLLGSYGLLVWYRRGRGSE